MLLIMPMGVDGHRPAAPLPARFAMSTAAGRLCRVSISRTAYVALRRQRQPTLMPLMSHAASSYRNLRLYPLAAR